MRLHAKNLECRRAEAEALARARETTMIATVARRLLRGGGVGAQLGWISGQVAEALGAASARIEIGPVPAPREGERLARLELEGRTGWLYAEGGDDPAIVAAPLTGIIDVALERERVVAQEAAAEAARKGNVAKTAVCISSPTTCARSSTRSATPSTRSREPRAGRLHLAVDRAHAAGRRPRRPLAPGVRHAADDARGARPARGRPTRREPAIPRCRSRCPPTCRPSPPTATRSSASSATSSTTRCASRRRERRCGSPAASAAAGDRAGHRPRAGHPAQPSARGSSSRSSRAARRRRPGGLGLAISRGFVEANGGRIVLQSGQNGETAFAVSLPLARPVRVPRLMETVDLQVSRRGGDDHAEPPRRPQRLERAVRRRPARGGRGLASDEAVRAVLITGAGRASPRAPT